MTRVLVIDDDPTLRKVLSAVLVRAGFDVLSAQDGRDGLAKFHEGLPDVVLTDLYMPEKEGLETILELRRANPDAKIIAMTGGYRGRGMEMLPAAARFGAQVTLQKPIDPKVLVATIHSLAAGPGPDERPSATLR